MHYYGLGQNKKWGEESTYGGKLTENIVQAIARDCLAETLRRIDERGLRVVFHVHDEVIIDADKEAALKSGMNAQVAKPLDVDLLMEVLHRFLC